MLDLMHVRLATPADLDAINEIYNHYVPRSTCTYDREPMTLADRKDWFTAHDGPHPVTVAEQAGRVLGWGCLSAFRSRWGYRHTVENSLYVHPSSQRLGIGRTLLRDLIERARALGHHTLLAGVSADQAASIALHAEQGFVEVARLRQVGHKFDRWLDVIFLQLMI